MKYQKHTLKNGLRIILAPMLDTETATVIVMTGVGSRYETQKENGLAHFLEHMFFKGTKKRPNTIDISRELDAIGAEYNAYTAKDHTAYYAKVEAHHWDTALDVVSDLFLNAKLEPEEIDRERGTILQEINMYEDMPQRRVGEHFEKLLYGTHPLGREILGPKDNIKAFRRQDFIKYLNRGYTAENVVVGVAGKIDPKRVKKEIEKHFAHIRTGKRPAFKKIGEKQAKPMLSLHHKKTDQTHIIVGVRAYDMFHKDRFALSILATILGGGMSSRLFMEVRERRGLTYSVHTGVDTYHDAGYLATQCGVEHENLEKALVVILGEYKKAATELVNDEELKKAKEYIKGHFALGMEGSDDVVGYLVTQETVRHEIVLPKERAKMIDRVTAEDVRRVAQDIFVNKKLNMAVIGPHSAKAVLSRILNVE
ncbi:MAG: pitrilysin family protein [Patescibacteria group bacterium]